MDASKKPALSILSLLALLLCFHFPAAAATILTEYSHLASIPAADPTAVALDAGENLHVASSARNSVLIFNSKRQYIQTLAGLAGPISVAVDQHGRIHVGNTGRHNVEVYSPDRNLLFKLGVGDGEFLQPAAIAIAASTGEIYVADGQAGVVKVYNADGTRKITIGSPGSTPGQFNRPVGLAIDDHTADTELLVLDRPITTEGSPYNPPREHEGARVQAFSMTGQYRRSFSSNGVELGEGKLIRPLGLAVDNTGRIFISDAYQHIIQAFSSATGAFLGAVYDQQHQLRTPLGLAIGRETNRIFAVSTGTESIEAYGWSTQHIVTASADSGGTITPVGEVSVRHGESASFAITPDPDHQVAAVKIDGTAVGTPAQYTFELVIANHTIEALFKKPGHTITATAGPNGTITPAGATTVPAGGSQIYNFAAAGGYQIAELLVDGQSMQIPDASYTFSDVDADHTIHVNFATQVYTITKITSGGGVITPLGPITIPHGGSQDISIVPTAGYHIHDVLVDSVSQGPVPSYSFSQVSANHTVQAEFWKNSYTITAGSTGNGAIQPTGSIPVSHGDDKTFNFVPADGFELRELLVDGLSLEPCDSFTFNNINANHTLTAVFVASNKPPVAVAGPDQNVGGGTVVVLNGANSFDPDSDSISSYLWEQEDGIAVTIPNPESAQTSFVAPEVDRAGASLAFRLTVTDADGVHSSDDCLINIIARNQAPVAVAGQDQTVEEQETVVLDGSASYDPDQEPLTFQWQQLAGISVDFDPTAESPSFEAPVIEEEGAGLMFRLTVSDTNGLRARDYCVVNISKGNPPPVAEAGPSQTVFSGQKTELDASGSYDDDNETLKYRWKQTKGSPVTITGQTSDKAFFTAPVEGKNRQQATFLLTVEDQQGLIATDRTTVETKRETARASLQASANGKWFKIYFKFPEDYPLSLINSRSIELSGINGVSLDSPLSDRRGSSTINNDRLLLEVDSGKLLPLLPARMNSLTLQGKLLNGTAFEQTFTVKTHD